MRCKLQYFMLLRDIASNSSVLKRKKKFLKRRIKEEIKEEMKWRREDAAAYGTVAFNGTLRAEVFVVP